MSYSKRKQSSLLIGCIICSVAALFYCYEFILRATPGIMLPQLMHAFKVNAHAIGLLASSYYLLYTPLQIPSGLLVDRYGPKRLLCVSITLCTLGCFIMHQSHHLSIAAYGQLFIGAGSAIAFVGALKLAKNWLPKEYFSLVVGFITTLGMFGAISTNSILIQFIHQYNWRSVWYVLGISGLILSLIMLWVLQDTPKVGKNSSLKKILSKSHLFCSWGQLFSQLSKIINNKIFILNAIIGSVLFLPLMLIGTLWGVSFLKNSYHLSTHTAGIINAMLFVGMSLGAPCFAWLSKYIQKLSLILFSCFTSSAILFFILSTNQLSILALLCLFLILGFVLGAEILIFDIATLLVPHKLSGTAIAITNGIIMMPEMFISPIIGKLLDKKAQFFQHHHEFLTFSDYQYALIILPILLLLGLFLTIYLIKVNYLKIEKKP